jgi:hypothetical protein
MILQYYKIMIYHLKIKAKIIKSLDLILIYQINNNLIKSISL